MAGLAEAKIAIEARRIDEYCILGRCGCCMDGNCVIIRRWYKQLLKE